MFQRVQQFVFVATCLVAMSLCGTAFATDYYVNPNGGNDGLNGTTPAQAVATIDVALGKAVPGDTVHLQGKTYTEQVVFPRSGEAGKTIVLDGEGATLYGPSWLWTWSGVVEIHGKSYLTVKRCNIREAKWFGIIADNWSHDILIDGNSTTNTIASGIYAHETWALTINSNVVDNACTGTDYSQPEVQECISVGVTSGFTISWNTVKNSWAGVRGGEGIDAKEGSADGYIHHNNVNNLTRLGIYVDGYDKEEKDIRVYSNTVAGTGVGTAVSSEAGGLTHDIKIYDNDVLWCRDNGIVVSSYVQNGPRANIWIDSNRVSNNANRGIVVETNNISNVNIRWNHVWNNTNGNVYVFPGISGVYQEGNW